MRLFIYELLNNVGVSDPADGLDKLMSFWSAFKVFDTTIEKYLIKWIKDYHVYYELPVPFKLFLTEHGLQSHYPGIAGYEPETNLDFARLCGISKYNIKQSAFYNDETSGLIADCFDFVICRLQTLFSGAGINFNDLIFQSSKSKTVWPPFDGALFYPASRQPDRRVVLSDNEIPPIHWDR